MTDQEILIEVAKLDGLIWKPPARELCLYPSRLAFWHFHTGDSIVDEIELRLGGTWDTTHETRAYLSSRDAIVPVIEKHLKGAGDISCFMRILDKEVAEGTEFQNHHIWCWYMIKATPRQLCIALLKATGKWR